MKRQGGEQCARHVAARTALLLLALMICIPAAAQTTRLAPTGVYENEFIRKTDNAPTTRQAGAVNPSTSYNSLDARRVIFALALVIALIFGLRWVVKKYFPSVIGGSNGAVRVLSRSPLTPKQHVLLVQVGKRVLVVADNGTQMNPLSEITDPDEVALLVGQISARPAAKEVFDSTLDKAQESYEDKPAMESEVADVAESPLPTDEQSLGLKSGEIEGLMEKVRALAKQVGRS